MSEITYATNRAALEPALVLDRYVHHIACLAIKTTEETSGCHPDVIVQSYHMALSQFLSGWTRVDLLNATFRKRFDHIHVLIPEQFHIKDLIFVSPGDDAVFECTMRI